MAEKRHPASDTLACSRAIQAVEFVRSTELRWTNN